MPSLEEVSAVARNANNLAELLALAPPALPSLALNAGSWTPVDGSGAGLSITVTAASYVTLGNLVYARCAIVYPVTASGANAQIDGLPFAGIPASSENSQGGITYSTLTVARYSVFIAASQCLRFFDSAGVRLTNLQLSGGTIYAWTLYSRT